MNASIESVRLLLGAPGRYALRLARSTTDLVAAQTEVSDCSRTPGDQLE